jgi:hypothetical protein
MSEIPRPDLSTKSPSRPEENDGRNYERGLRFWAVIAGLAITTLLAALEHTVVVTSAPAILTELELEEMYIWLTNSFFICR